MKCRSKCSVKASVLIYQSSSLKVATIRGNIDKIAQDVEQVKKMHSLMLSAAVQEQGINIY